MPLAAIRLRRLPLPARLLLIGFLLSVVAAFVAAQVTNHATHAGLDGDPSPSVEDIVLAFHGRPGATLLGAKVSPGGSMEKYVPLPAERDAVIAWANDGAAEDGFPPAAAILERRCIRCHHPNGEMASVPYASTRGGPAELELVRVSTVPDTGISTARLGRSTHAHLFGMGTLFLLAGGVLLLSEASAGVKLAGVVLPFGGMFVDIACWWLTRWDPMFAYGIIAGGIVLSLGFVVLVAVPLWELLTPGRGSGAHDEA